MDDARAYFYTDANRDIYVKLPIERQQEGDEVHENWQRKCAQIGRALGFRVGKVSPCHLFCKEENILGLVRGDDVVVVGRTEHLEDIADYMASEGQRRRDLRE